LLLIFTSKPFHLAAISLILMALRVYNSACHKLKPGIAGENRAALENFVSLK
jgi:hypothetical protein